MKMADETDEQKRARREQVTRARDLAHQLVRAKAFDDAGELIDNAFRAGVHDGVSLARRLFAEAENIRAQIALDSQGDD